MSSKRLVSGGILVIIVLALLHMAAVAHPVAVRLEAGNDEDVIRYAEAGLSLKDVEIGIYPAVWGDGILVTWNRENGYVTAVVEEEYLLSIPEEFNILCTFPLTPASDPRPAGELDDPEEFEISWGWPADMHGFPTISHQVPTIADLDGNGDLEISLNTIEGYLYAWQHSGARTPGYPKGPAAPNRSTSWVSTSTWETGVTIDIDGDEVEEIVFGASSGIMFALEYAPYEIEELIWKDLGTGMFSGVPAVYDVNDDGVDEIIIHVYDPFTSAPRQGFLHIFNRDGYDIEGWPKIYSNPTSSSPAVGDIDGDNEPEIIIATGHSLDATAQILAWNADGTEVDGWLLDGFYTIGGSPTLADIDGEPGLEVILRCMEIGGENGIYAWNGNGDLIDGFPLEVPVGHPYGSVAVADMDDNGLLDFAVGTVELEGWARVLVFEQGSGIRDGFPRFPGGPWIGGSPVFADVNGDGLPEVIVSQRYSCGDDNRAGVVAYDADGVEIGAGYPEEDDDGQFPTSPTAYDINGDGNIELMAASTSGRLYVWDTEGIPGESMFPCEKGDFHRTGAYLEGQWELMSADDATNDGLPSEFDITSIYPSPFNSTTRIRFDLPAEGKVDIRVFDLLGHEVATLAAGRYTAGSHRVIWNARNNLPSGMYFIHGEFGKKRVIRKALYMK